MTHSYQIQTGQSMLAKTLVNLEEIMDLRILSGGAIAEHRRRGDARRLKRASARIHPFVALARAAGRRRGRRFRLLAPLGWMAPRLASRMGLASRTGMAWRLASLGLGSWLLWLRIWLALLVGPLGPPLRLGLRGAQRPA